MFLSQRRIGVVSGFQTPRGPDRRRERGVCAAGYGIRRARHQQDSLVGLDWSGLRNRQGAYPGELSGGEQQRVAIARARVRNPDILIADEPTGNLDPDTSMEIFKLLERANMYGTTIVCATHARHIVNTMRKRVIELRKGTVVRDVRRGAYEECDIPS